MAFLRGVWGALSALGRRSGAELCAGCERRARSPGSFVYVSNWFSSTVSGYPKKPLTPYFRFLKDQLPVLKTDNPGTKMPELVRRIAELWSRLPHSEKKIYEEAFWKDQKVYKEKVHRFYEELTPDQKISLANEVKEKRLKRKKFLKKKEVIVLGKPKRARSAFNIFISENFQDAKNDTVQERLKSVVQTWKNLPTSQKEVYLQLAKDDKIRYDNEMKSWEENMIEAGRGDLVRPIKKHQKKDRRD
ncbi:transcription factor A, mitochondrial [Ctenodactylus gundi]